MGNSLSSWGGQSRVQKIINKAGLPLEIDASQDEDEKTPLSTFTEAYPAPGWFTGVKSAVTIEKSVEEVYNSLAKDLHHVFTPMSECDDEVQQDDGEGKQVIFRIVRIPFKVAFVTGNLKLRLNVKQDKKAGKIHFESAKEGRLITKFVADFDIHPSPDRPDETIVKLDSKVSCKSLPPPPFKNMVKDVMVKKMDSCMVDLLNFHTQDVSDDDFASACDESVHGDELGKNDASLPSQRSAYGGFMDMVRSFSAPLRHSLELLEKRYSVEKPRQPGLQDTAQDTLGHHPTAEISVKPATTDVNEPQASSVYSDSSLYKPSTERQKSPLSQADVFSEWQEKPTVPSSPFLAASK